MQKALKEVAKFFFLIISGFFINLNSIDIILYTSQKATAEESLHCIEGRFVTIKRKVQVPPFLKGNIEK